MTGVNCHQCHKGTGIEAGSSVFRTTECPHCFADLRCCKMCRFYDPSSYNECHETQADRVTQKDKANFCAFFEFVGTKGKQDSNDHQASAAEALFKK